MEKTIDTLRKFFTISVAAFEMQHTVRIAFGYKGHKSYMHNLHLLAKEELEKDNPDMNTIDKYLAIMEGSAGTETETTKRAFCQVCWEPLEDGIVKSMCTNDKCPTNLGQNAL
jgi:hypothetical protein